MDGASRMPRWLRFPVADLSPLLISRTEVLFANWQKIMLTSCQWANSVLKDYLLRGHAINQRIERPEQRVAKTEEQIGFFIRTALPPAEGIFYDGQIFDAYTFVSDLIRSAQQRVILIDSTVYHLGASLKDLGKKLFALNRMGVAANGILNGK